MQDHKKVKIRAGLFHLLKEEEENLPLIEEKLKYSDGLVENEREKIEKEKEEFIKEMEAEKERLIAEGIKKVEEECDEIYKEGKKKAEELLNNIEKYKEIALKVFEEIILKGGED